MDSDRTRILIIRPGALGDTVVAEPAVAAICARYPQAHIELAGRTDYLPLLVGPGLADACVSTDSAAFTSLFGPGRLELPRSDLVLAYLPDPDGALSARLNAHAGKAVVSDPRPDEGKTTHIVDHLLVPLGRLDVPAVRDCPRLPCRHEWSDAARAVCPPLQDGVDYAVIHPGSGGRHKLWPAESWAAVIGALHPLTFVLTCGPADAEVVDDLLAHMTDRSRARVLKHQPATTVAGVLAGARAYVGCDSGVTHLAAALGVPTVAVFGPTDPRIWAPRGKSVQVVAGSRGSTASVTPSAVLDALDAS